MGVHSKKRPWLLWSVQGQASPLPVPVLLWHMDTYKTHLVGLCVPIEAWLGGRMQPTTLAHAACGVVYTRCMHPHYGKNTRSRRVVLSPNDTQAALLVIHQCCNTQKVQARPGVRSCQMPCTGKAAATAATACAAACNEVQFNNLQSCRAHPHNTPTRAHFKSRKHPVTIPLNAGPDTPAVSPTPQPPYTPTPLDTPCSDPMHMPTMQEPPCRQNHKAHSSKAT